jgi:hypothetical protein
MLRGSNSFKGIPQLRRQFKKNNQQTMTLPGKINPGCLFVCPSVSTEEKMDFFNRRLQKNVLSYVDTRKPPTSPRVH